MLTMTDSLKMVEGMQLVFQKVMNLLSPNGPGLVVYNTNGDIDFRHYLIEYWHCMLFVDFAVWLKSLQKKEEKAGPGDILMPNADAVETIVFGG